MIAVDTNILVRYAVKDDSSLTRKASQVAPGSHAILVR